MIVRKIKSVDLDRVCEIHLISFDKSHFTSRFSTKMLKSYFENLLVACPYSYVAIEDGAIVGYIFAGVNPKNGIKRFTNKNIIKILFLFLRYPSFLIEKMIELLKKRSKENSRIIAQPTIYIIASDPNYKLGIGSLLLKHFEDCIRGENYSSYYLSVRKKNINAIKFYENNGFLLMGSNRTSYNYHKYLPN